MNNHEVESILCQVKCDCCGSVTTYDEEDIKKIDIDNDIFICPRCKHREHFANVHAIVGAKFIKNEN